MCILPGPKYWQRCKIRILYTNSRFRNVPTIYPPGAQVVYLISYLLAPANLYFLKGLFVIFDMVTCVALIVLLGRKGLDQRRVILYAWCPLPIIEFAIQGHVDVITLTFTILAILAASNHSVRGYMLTGFLIGLATLTKIYPILLLVVILPDGKDKDTPVMQPHEISLPSLAWKLFCYDHRWLFALSYFGTWASIWFFCCLRQRTGPECWRYATNRTLVG